MISALFQALPPEATALGCLSGSSKSASSPPRHTIPPKPE